MVDRLWGKEGSVTIRFLAPSVYMIIFPSQRVRDWVLETGSWHILQKVIVLRRWTPGLLLDELKLDSAPIWVKLWHVPLELYSQQGLSYVASVVGKPLYSDRATTLKHQLEFAKVCIEIDAKDDLPCSVLVDIGSDTLVSIVVEVVWSPPRCKHCMIFCHSDENCGNIVHKGVVDSGFTVVPGVDAQGQDVSYIVKVVDPGLVSNEASMVDYVEHAGTVCAEVDFAPLPKEVEKGGGIRLSVCGKPSNSFEALSVGIVEECVLPVDESELDSPKKRIAAGGVAELLQQLKPQAKEAKAKKKGKVVQKYDIDVVCLLETRIRECNACDILSGKFRGWSVVHNYGHAHNGRIWILSKDQWTVEVICHSAQVVNCSVKWGDVVFFLSVVYASNSRDDIVALWNDLVEFKGKVGDNPWAIADDFNIISKPKESSDFDGSQGFTGAMLEFRDCLEALDANSNVEEVSDELLRDILGVGLTEKMCEALIALVLGREIKDVLFAMDGNKAPGPDGYTAKFFQAAWGIVGGDVIKGV
ncbi:hypothetical protein V6N13_032185 [Hibiscus sabdariffa]